MSGDEHLNPEQFHAHLHVAHKDDKDDDDEEALQDSMARHPSNQPAPFPFFQPVDDKKKT